MNDQISNASISNPADIGILSGMRSAVSTAPNWSPTLPPGLF